MKPIITISGTPGSGKSTVAKNLIKLLKAKRIYVGGIRRKLAKKKKMTLAELNEYALTHPETDVDIDKAAAKDAREKAKKNIVVVEGRTQFHFLPESIKLFFKVSSKEGAKRIWKELKKKEAQLRRNEGSFKSMSDLEKSLKEREKNDLKRYKKYYKINFLDKKNYDLIIDTTNISALEVTKKAYDFITKRI